MTVKKSLPIIIILLLSITLASCKGIGDGALYPSYDATSAGTPDSFNISSNISIRIPSETAMTCEIKSNGYSEKVSRKLEGTEAYQLWQIACYYGRIDFSGQVKIAKGTGAYFDIIYKSVYENSESESSLRIYENDVVSITKNGLQLSVSSTRVYGLREGIFAEIERYLGLE